jgi:hypothetical protein
MSFTYDVTTTIGKMRLLLGDTVQASANFQDEELQAILDTTDFILSGPSSASVFGSALLPENEVLFMACANAMDALAARVASSANGQTVKIGDYSITGKDQVQKLQDIAQRFRDAIENMPAWGVIEENLSGFNELLIMRNWILKTEM